MKKMNCCEYGTWSYPLNIDSPAKHIIIRSRVWIQPLALWEHRDSADACKNVSSFEIIMFAVYWSHSWFWYKAKKQFLDQIWCFFYNKNKNLTILIIVKYEKITFFDAFLVLSGPIISRVFCMFKWGKNE